MFNSSPPNLLDCTGGNCKIKSKNVTEEKPLRDEGAHDHRGKTKKSRSIKAFSVSSMVNPPQMI